MCHHLICCAYNTGPNDYLSEVWLEQAKRRRKGAYVSDCVASLGMERRLLSS